MYKVKLNTCFSNINIEIIFVCGVFKSMWYSKAYKIKINNLFMQTCIVMLRLSLMEKLLS